MEIPQLVRELARRNSENTKRRPGIFIIATAAIITLYLPVFIWLVNSWLENPYYGHGFLIPLISGMIFWLRRDNFKLQKPSSVGAIVLGVGLVLYVLAYAGNLQYASALSLPIALFGIIAYLCGKERAQAFLFPILFLIFMIPLPFLSMISYYLQNITTHSSAAIARLFGITVITTGNQLELSNTIFTIGTACSGISSLISLLAIAVILTFLVEGSSRKRLILFLSAFPIAVVANTLRVVSTLAVSNQWGSQVAISFFHGFSGIFFFLFAVALLLVIVKLLRCRFRTLTELSHG